ncbi:MAG: GatB/YqeY domain-containing protein [Acidobacteria bacterium]|nr:GatB/YqeY domain-containing protein [Acidobacteriota bacterium]
MSIQESINEDLKRAMKNRETTRLSTLRMVKAALKNREIEKMSPLSEEESIKELQRLVNQRSEAIDQYKQGGRMDLAEKEAAEITVIEQYLPVAVDQSTIIRIVEETIAELGAVSIKEMGRIMKAVMAKLAGQRVDGKEVSQIVKSKLGG